MAGSDTPQQIADAALAACDPSLDAFEREALKAHRSVGNNDADALAKTALLIEEVREVMQSDILRMVRAYRRYAPSLKD